MYQNLIYKIMKNLLFTLLMSFSFLTYSQISHTDLNDTLITVSDTLRFDFDGDSFNDFEISRNDHFIKIRPLADNVNYTFIGIAGWAKALTCRCSDNLDESIDYGWAWNAYPWFPYLGDPEGWGENAATYKIPFRLEYLIDLEYRYKYGYLEFYVDNEEELTVQGWYINHTLDESIICDSEVNDSLIYMDEHASLEENYIEIVYDVYNFKGEKLDKNNLPKNQLLIKVYSNGKREKFVIQ